MSSDGDNECPLCLEEIDVYDKYFKPCPCGYQLCRFCWNHIKKDLNALCPACRRPYQDKDIEFTPISQEEILSIKTKKKQRERELKEREQNNRKQLANVRVVQKNLVYVLGLPSKLCTEETLRSLDYFGQYGKITKIVINKKQHTNGVYITFANKQDAQKAIEQVDGTQYEMKLIRATFGTTKYCSYYLKNQSCQNIGCQFLHESGEDAETYLKEETLKFNQRQDRPIKMAFTNPKSIKIKDEEQFPSLEPAHIDETKPKLGKLLPRYNGLFDPFGSDRLLKTLLQLVSEKSEEKKSRYERLFEKEAFLGGIPATGGETGQP